MRRTLGHRLARLELRLAPKRQWRVVIRREGPGSERFPQPTQDELENYPVVTLRFVPAKDGRPATPEEIKEMYPDNADDLR